MQRQINRRGGFKANDITQNVNSGRGALNNSNNNGQQKNGLEIKLRQMTSSEERTKVNSGTGNTADDIQTV